MLLRPAPTPRSPIAVVLTLALLLPLIAACGASSPTASLAPTRGPVEAPASGTAPTSAPAAPPTAGDSTAERPALTSATAAPAGAPAAAIGGAATAAPATGGLALQATPIAAPQPPVVNQQQTTPLKAGEIDDNVDFAAYLDYLRSNDGLARTVDVSERYLLTVTNQQQQPILDARVRLFDQQQQLVFEGRTSAGGRTIVFPRALGLSDNLQTLQVQIDKGNRTAQGTLTRGQDSTQSFVLRDAEPLPATPRLDVLFLLDATGSMGDEISQIQQTIGSIAEQINQLQPRPALRFGLVSYRDEGDEYIARADDFTPELATFQQLLSSVRADGGGDEPEALDEGLYSAIHRVSWAEDAVRLTFLVADAPPHLDRGQNYDYVQGARAAVGKGIKVYTIAASNSSDAAEYVFRQIAQQTLGHFIFLTYQAGQNAGTPGDTTTHQVDPAAFTVERLDDLVVQAIERELALAQGKG